MKQIREIVDIQNIWTESDFVIDRINNTKDCLCIACTLNHYINAFSNEYDTLVGALEHLTKILESNLHTDIIKDFKITRCVKMITVEANIFMSYENNSELIAFMKTVTF